MKQRYGTFVSLLIAAFSNLCLAGSAAAQYTDWQHSGSVFIVTTPEGAHLPASASVRDFPLLVRLHSDFFDFAQARPQGEDIRFSTPAGQELPYQEMSSQPP